MKTSELIGPALDWALAKALGKVDLKPLKDAEINGRLPYDFDLCFDIHNWEDVLDIMHCRPTRCDCSPFELIDFAKELGFYIFHKAKEAPYSITWALAGPIIERESICISPFGPSREGWDSYQDNHHAEGPTPLIAAMRCYVASKLGNEVEIPKELM